MQTIEYILHLSPIFAMPLYAYCLPNNIHIQYHPLKSNTSIILFFLDFIFWYIYPELCMCSHLPAFWSNSHTSNTNKNNNMQFNILIFYWMWIFLFPIVSNLSDVEHIRHFFSINWFIGYEMPKRVKRDLFYSEKRHERKAGIWNHFSEKCWQMDVIIRKDTFFIKIQERKFFFLILNPLCVLNLKFIIVQRFSVLFFFCVW